MSNCDCIEKPLSTYQINRYDPTRTTTLRNAMVRDSNRRFDELVRVVSISVDEEDCFGLKSGKPSIFKEKIVSYQMTSSGRNRFAFGTDQQKVAEFLRWIEEQIRKGILVYEDVQQFGESIYPLWTNKYIRAAYDRGVKRARSEMRSIGYAIPVSTAGMEWFSIPVHIERLGLLYIRTFNDLKGITEQMSQIIAKILTEGLMYGEQPKRLARKLVAAINGKGIGELGLTDKLGRFIPAKRRAEILARTEIIRAHHLATIQEYRNWGVIGVKVKAEVITAGDDRVCPQCASLEGRLFTLDEAEGLIPAHPGCRCCVTPCIIKS